MPITIFAVAMHAPVLPAETKPSALPSVTNRVPTLKELFFLRLTEVITGSPIRDDFSRFDQLDAAVAVAAPPATLEFGFNYLGLADKNHFNAKVACSGQRSVNLCMRRVVATHRVENDFSR